MRLARSTLFAAHLHGGLRCGAKTRGSRYACRTLRSLSNHLSRHSANRVMTRARSSGKRHLSHADLVKLLAELARSRRRTWIVTRGVEHHTSVEREPLCEQTSRDEQVQRFIEAATLPQHILDNVDERHHLERTDAVPYVVPVGRLVKQPPAMIVILEFLLELLERCATLCWVGFADKQVLFGVFERGHDLAQAIS